MAEVKALFRSRSTFVWLVLVLATLVSFRLGTSGADHAHRLASSVIIVVAIGKVRVVGLYFMELRAAPRLLRALFETYCAALCALLVGVFLLA